MQFMLGIIVLLLVVAFVIFKVNKKFEKKEALILIVVLAFSILAYIIYEKNSENYFPNLFEKKYLQEKNIAIEKLSFELINNKNISSKKEFIYKFIYIIQKDGKSFLCTAPKVKINKIGDEFVFTNFGDLQETCVEK